MVQFSHPHMTTGKTISSTWLTFVGKVMSLLFNMLSRLVIAFPPRSKCLNFMAAIIICTDFGAQEYRVSHCFHCFPHLFAMKWWGRMPRFWVFGNRPPRPTSHLFLCQRTACLQPGPAHGGRSTMWPPSPRGNQQWSLINLSDQFNAVSLNTNKCRSPLHMNGVPFWQQVC